MRPRSQDLPTARIGRPERGPSQAETRTTPRPVLAVRAPPVEAAPPGRGRRRSRGIAPRRLAASVAVALAVGFFATVGVLQLSSPAAQILPPAGKRTVLLGLVVANSEVTLRAPFAGTVVRVSEEGCIKAGQELATLAAPEQDRAVAAARAAFGEAEARRDRAVAAIWEARRRTQGAVTEEERSAGQAEERQRGRELVAAREALDERSAEVYRLARRRTVRAPFDGVLAARYVRPSQQVPADAPLFVAAAAGPPRLRFAARRDLVASLRRSSVVDARIESISGPLPFRVETLAADVDPGSPLVFVEAALQGDAPKSLRAGLLARVSFDPGRP